jgi:hypothetical protein
MLLPLGSGLTARTFCLRGFGLVIHAIGLILLVSCVCVCGWLCVSPWLRCVMLVREPSSVSSPSCYLLFLRRAIFRMLLANTARFFANPPLRFAAAIFFVVAFPNAPTVPFRFIFRVAFCIHRFLVAICFVLICATLLRVELRLLLLLAMARWIGRAPSHD